LLPLFILQKTQQYEKENNEHRVYRDNISNAGRGLCPTKTFVAAANSPNTAGTRKIRVFC
jgi:hypothetical protein